METGMARQKRTYSPEFRDEAVKMVIETSRPVAVVARELGLVEGALGNWVNAYRKNHPVEDRLLEMHDRARLKELERENRELRMQNDFLKKPPPSSHRIIDNRTVRVHRQREGRVSHRDDVFDLGGVALGVLCVA
jgi:transposase